MTNINEIIGEIIKDHLENKMTLDKLSKKYGFPKNTISRHLKLHGVNIVKYYDSSSRKQITESRNQEIIKLYLSGLKVKEVAVIFGMHELTIGRILNLNKIKPKHRTHYEDYWSKPEEDFFEKVDSERKAYFLGFWYADGTNDCLHNRIRLNLSQTDLSHSKLLKSFIDPQNKIKIYLRELKTINGNISKMCEWNAYSSKLCNDLTKLGCVPQKTSIIKFPKKGQVPYDLLRYFLLGVFDGDGSINCTDYLSVDKKTGYKYKRKHYSLSLCGTYNFLRHVKYLIYKVLNIKLSKKCIKKPSGTHILNISGCHQINAILSYLYNGSTIFLNRKNDKFLQLQRDIKNKCLCERVL